jgi:hypothetical protein
MLVGLAVVIPFVVRARRRGAWQAELDGCEREVAWFARTLVPELRATGSRQAVAGGWAVGEARVTAVEDRLTVLASSAPDETRGARASTLRDAVRASRLRLEALVGSATEEAVPSTLDEVIAELEAALAPSGPRASA